MTRSILAIDRGKYKSVARGYRTGGERDFTALASTPEARRPGARHRPDVVVIEACLPAGGVHDPYVSAGFCCELANTACERLFSSEDILSDRYLALRATPATPGPLRPRCRRGRSQMIG